MKIKWTRETQMWTPSKHFSKSGLTGQATKQATCAPDPIQFANNLHSCYAQYDTSDFFKHCESLMHSLPF